MPNLINSYGDSVLCICSGHVAAGVVLWAYLRRLSLCLRLLCLSSSLEADLLLFLLPLCLAAGLCSVSLLSSLLSMARLTAADGWWQVTASHVTPSSGPRVSCSQPAWQLSFASCTIAHCTLYTSDSSDTQTKRVDFKIYFCQWI